MTDNYEMGEQKSNQDFIRAFYLTLFIVWSTFLACMVITQNRGDLWPILATMMASLVVRLTLPFFSPSPLFSNTLLALFVATLIGFSATWIACKQWHSKGWMSLANHELLMHKSWQGAHCLLCFSIGAFCFDAFDLLHSSLHIHQPHALVHHAIVVIGLSTVLLFNVGFNYIILSLICEVHSIFAHLRRLLRMLGLHQDGSLLVKGEWGVVNSNMASRQWKLPMILCPILPTHHMSTDYVISSATTHHEGCFEGGEGGLDSRVHSQIVSGLGIDLSSAPCHGLCME
ncbi:hypothetical protein GOP47_0026604 [Adiantum capillus-veneris]|nr:hypothetical protein GOP47_0026604 [Adiantum capillus-veneris]